MSLRAAYNQTIDGYHAHLIWFDQEQSLPDSLVRGRRILDWECGNGAFAEAMLLRGAAEVVAIDTWYESSWTPDDSVIKPEKTDINTFADRPGSAQGFDLIFSNTVTEHIQDLVVAFTSAYRLLKPGGYFFSNHGNYYEPTGHHDHGFLFYANGGVEFTGTRCWETTSKCEASAEHRQRITKRFPHKMPVAFDTMLTPDNCGDCIYFKRAQPWAHLLYQKEFRTIFGTSSFTTGKSGSRLNKITSFLMRQALIETGFNLVKEHRSMVSNEPPPVLLEEPFNFNAIELKTAAHRFLAQKPPGAPCL